MRVMRNSLVGLGAVLAALCTVPTTAALAGGPSHRQAARPTTSNVHELSGTWTTSVQIRDAPPGVPSAFNALDTFEPGGGLVVSSSAPNPAARGLAHGSWLHVGHGIFTATFVWFRFDPAGTNVGTQRVRRTMKLSRSGQRFTATDVIEIIAPTGAVVATLHGTEAGMLLAD